MTSLKPFLVGWFILFSTQAIAAPKTKQGNKAQLAKQQAAVQSRHQTQSKFKTHKSTPAESFNELSMDSVLYKAQKMATEMTEEVGYLLKATGPWLKEIEEMIRGEQLETAAPSSKRALANADVSSAPKAGRRSPKRQLGQMSSSPGGILDTVVAVSKETWSKVHATVADLMGQAESISQ